MDDNKNRIDLGAELGGITDDLLKDIHAAAQDESNRQAQAKAPKKKGLALAYEKNKLAFAIGFFIIAILIASTVFISMARNSSDDTDGGKTRNRIIIINKSPVNSPVTPRALPGNTLPVAPRPNRFTPPPRQNVQPDTLGGM